MWQFSVQDRKVKGWNRSCFPTFIKPIHGINYCTGLLFCTTQKQLTPVKKLRWSLYVCICLKTKWKTDLIVLAKGFIEDLGDAIINLALIEFLCILGIQYISGNQWFSIRMLSMPNLIFRSLVFLSMILFADKPPALFYISVDELLFNPNSLVITEA